MEKAVLTTLFCSYDKLNVQKGKCALEHTGSSVFMNSVKETLVLLFLMFSGRPVVAVCASTSDTSGLGVEDNHLIHRNELLNIRW